MKKIAVIASEYDFIPKNGYFYANELYYELSRNFEVILVFLRSSEYFFEKNIPFNLNDNMSCVFIDIPMEKVHRGFENLWVEFFPDGSDKLISEKLLTEVGEVEFVLAELFTFSFAISFFRDKKIIYRAMDSFAAGFENNFTYNKDWESVPESEQVQSDILSSVKNAERECCERSALILCLTEIDSSDIQRRYGVPDDKIVIMPICMKQPQIYKDLIPRNKQSKEINCCVVSSANFASREIIAACKDLCTKVHSVKFHIFGIDGCYDSSEAIPGNFIIYGNISENRKQEILSICDCAIHYVRQAHGMNSKVWDFILNGITILSNSLSMRGYGFQPGEHYFPISIDTFESDMRNYFALSAKNRYQYAIKSYKCAMNKLNYENFMARVYEALRITIESEPDSYQYYLFGAGGQQARLCHTDLEKKIERLIGIIDNDANRWGHISFVPEKVVEQPTSVFQRIKDNKEVKVIIVGGQLISCAEKYMQTIKAGITSDRIELFYGGKRFEAGQIDWNLILARCEIDKE